MNELGRGGHRLDRTGFVVRRHQRDEGAPSSKMVFRKLGRKRFEIDQTVAGDGNAGRALRVEAAAGKDRRMLHRRDVALPRLGGRSGERQGIGLAAAAGEDHLFRAGAGKRGHFCPRILHQRPRLSPLAMNGGRIAEDLETGDHGVAHFGSQWRGGVIVKIGADGHASSSSRPRDRRLALARAPIARAMKRGPRLKIVPNKAGRHVVWNSSKSWFCIGFLGGRVKVCSGPLAASRLPALLLAAT